MVVIQLLTHQNVTPTQCLTSALYMYIVGASLVLALTRTSKPKALLNCFAHPFLFSFAFNARLLLQCLKEGAPASEAAGRSRAGRASQPNPPMMLPPTGAPALENDGSNDAGPRASGDDAKEEVGVIYTCKFPGCTRQYASTDGARASTCGAQTLRRSCCASRAALEAASALG
jgi:hypothetical protein